MVGHSPKNKKLKAKQPKENVLTAACGQSPWNKKSKAAQTNKDIILINIPRDPSRKHAKNSKQGFAGISLDNTMKLRNSRLDRDGNAT